MLAIPKPTKADRKTKRKAHTVKKKRASVAKLIKEADRLFSLYIRRTGRSLYSGKAENLQCSHLIPRGFWKYRWDECNAIPLTAGEHLYGWHGQDGGSYHFWLKTSHPSIYEWYEQANFIAHSTTNKRPSLSEMEETIARLRKLLDSLN